VLDVVAQVRPSERAELEITDVNRLYLEQGRLRVRDLGRGLGSTAERRRTAQFVKVVQERTGLRVACPEEIAYRRGFRLSLEMDQCGAVQSAGLRRYFLILIGRGSLIGPVIPAGSRSRSSMGYRAWPQSSPIPRSVLIFNILARW
jgi:hypothetical protein